MKSRFTGDVKNKIGSQYRTTREKNNKKKEREEKKFKTQQYQMVGKQKTRLKQ